MIIMTVKTRANIGAAPCGSGGVVGLIVQKQAL